MIDFSLHIMDILQNSIKAGANVITTRIETDKEKDEFSISVQDDGCGMDEEFLKSVRDPFTTTRTTRRVGLGIPLFEDSFVNAEGGLDIVSGKNSGTTIRGSCRISHIDRIPLGDVAQTFMQLISSDPQINFVLILENGIGSFHFSVEEVKEQLGDVPIDSMEVLEWIKDYINEGIKEIFGGVLNEITG